MKSRVIQIDCPYKGKHKYELSPNELREYERIKKQYFRTNNKRIIVTIWCRKEDFKSNVKEISHWMTEFTSSEFPSKKHMLEVGGEWIVIEKGYYKDNTNNRYDWVHLSGYNYYSYDQSK